MKREVLTDILDKIIDYRGKTPKKLGGDWSKSGYRALSALQVKTTGLQNLDDCRYVDEEIYKKWMKEEVERGDILMTSEAPAGQVFYWDSDEKIVLSQRLFCLRVNKEHNPIYIKYYLQSDTGQRAILGNLSGSTVSGVSAKTFKYTAIFTRTLEEETKIADILYALDKKIDTNNAIIQTYEKIMHEVYDYWFLQYDFPNINGLPYKNSGGEMAYSESLKKNIPKNWNVYNIEDLATLTWGQCPDGSNILSKSTTGNDILPYCSGAGDMHDSYVANCQAVTNASRREVEKGTILLSVAGTIGNMAITDKKISLGRATLGLTPRNSKYSAIIWMLLKSFNQRLQTTSVGAVQKIINKNNLKEINIALPEIMPNVDLLNDAMSHILELSVENNELSSLRDWLLPMLLNGQLKIN